MYVCVYLYFPISPVFCLYYVPIIIHIFTLRLCPENVARSPIKAHCTPLGSQLISYYVPIVSPDFFVMSLLFPY